MMNLRKTDQIGKKEKYEERENDIIRRLKIMIIMTIILVSVIFFLPLLQSITETNKLKKMFTLSLAKFNCLRVI